MDESIEAMRVRCDSVASANEAGLQYLLLKRLRLPDGCDPSVADALLCLGERDGYATRLFLSAKAQNPRGAKLNWNHENVHILGGNWFAFSWKVPAGQPVSDILDQHLKALT